MAEHFGEVIDSKDGIDVIECKGCGFKHIVPLPTPEELEKLYQGEYYSTEKPRYIQEAEEDLEWLETTYREYYKMLDMYACGETKRLLEIGSGPGFFLNCGKELGWDVTGIEPSRQAYQYSQRFGVKVINDTFSDDVVAGLGRFDMVFMDTVIEHLPDPRSLLETVKNVLDQHGVLCVISPNDYNPLQKILREHLSYDPWWVVPHHHINYFDFHSMQGLLRKSGFEVLETTATFPMELFLLFGENYVKNGELGRRCHSKRKFFEENMYKWGGETMSSMNKAFADIGIGRKFVIIAKV